MKSSSTVTDEVSVYLFWVFWFFRFVNFLGKDSSPGVSLLHPHYAFASGWGCLAHWLEGLQIVAGLGVYVIFSLVQACILTFVAYVLIWLPLTSWARFSSRLKLSCFCQLLR